MPASRARPAPALTVSSIGPAPKLLSPDAQKPEQMKSNFVLNHLTSRPLIMVTLTPEMAASLAFRVSSLCRYMKSLRLRLCVELERTDILVRPTLRLPSENVATRSYFRILRYSGNIIATR